MASEHFIVTVIQTIDFAWRSFWGDAFFLRKVYVHANVIALSNSFYPATGIKPLLITIVSFWSNLYY